MKKIIIILTTIITVFGCSNEENQPEEIDPCSLLVDGVYMYPTVPPDSTLTQEEIYEYWNIPEEVLGCLNTDGLIKSCYKTIYGIAIDAANGYQAGYDLVKAGCRGFSELEQRSDAPGELISYFKSIEVPNHIDYNLYAIEIATSQEGILKKFTHEQKIELVNLSLNYHAQRRNIFNKDPIRYDGMPVIMGRLLVNDEDVPFLHLLEQNNELDRFLEGTTTYRLSIDNADSIVYYTNLYLDKLNSN